MVRYIKIKTKRLDTRCPDLGLNYRFASHAPCSACGLTDPPEQYMLESECIYNDPVDTFVANSVKIDPAVLSQAKHTDR